MTIKIYKPTKSSMQSGLGKTKKWLAEYIIDTDKVFIKSKESLYYYMIYRKYFDAPINLHSSKFKCPNCRYEIKPNSKFCRMCGSFPI